MNEWERRKCKQLWEESVRKEKGEGMGGKTEGDMESGGRKGNDVRAMRKEEEKEEREGKRRQECGREERGQELEGVKKSGEE